MVRNDGRRSVFVTGSGSGIGMAIAERLLEDDYDLIAHYNTSEKGATLLKKGAKQQNVKLIEGNFANAASFNTFLTKLQEMLDKTGPLSAVIHCAGLNEKKQYSEINLQDYNHIFDVNIKAPLFITRDLMVRSRLMNGASVVFIGTPNSFIGGSTRNMLYTASKTALLGITKSLAKELAPEVRVNCIVPGFIGTRMLYEKNNEAALEEKRIGIPLERFGKPEEVAELMAFIISEKAAYMTGQSVHLDGGLYFS